jgi:hypothetical protein
VAEQRNPYRGARPWLRLGFRALDGAVHRFDLVADTGSAPALLLRPDALRLLTVQQASPRTTNLGKLPGAWVQLYNPEFDGLVELTLAYGSNQAADMAAKSDPKFVGLIGLPLLRLGEYGGNATDFWFRYPPTPPTTSTP